jgi:hypothetical protein
MCSRDLPHSGVLTMPKLTCSFCGTNPSPFAGAVDWQGARRDIPAEHANSDPTPQNPTCVCVCLFLCRCVCVCVFVCMRALFMSFFSYCFCIVFNFYIYVFVCVQRLLWAPIRTDPLCLCIMTAQKREGTASREGGACLKCIMPAWKREGPASREGRAYLKCMMTARKREGTPCASPGAVGRQGARGDPPEALCGGISKINFQETLSSFGDKCPQNGSKNGLRAPRTGMGCPHIGPSVDSC